MPRRQRPSRPAWTPNQLVAHNIAKARLLRGWTQDQAAEACEPYLGKRLSPASWSALERSVDGGRIREITADELVGFARGFDVPIGFLLTPPSGWDGHVVATPDAGPDGLAPIELFDVVIGTSENLGEWETFLKSWPSPQHRVRFGPDGRMENLGRVEEDVHPRLQGPASLRARLLLRDELGDVDNARDLLTRLIAVLDQLDELDTDTRPAATQDNPRRTKRPPRT